LTRKHSLTQVTGRPIAFHLSSLALRVWLPGICY